jgi:hypothetical protein
MSVRRHLAGTLAVPLLVVALTACGGGDDSVADPPISSPPTSSPTQAPHRESAEHFIRRWFQAGTQMQNSGETEAYRKMQRGCRGCMDVAARVKKTYARGGFFRTKGVRTLHIDSTSASRGKLVVDLSVDLYPTTYRDRAGAKAKHFHGGPARFQVTLRRAEASWLVASFVEIAS